MLSASAKMFSRFLTQKGQLQRQFGPRLAIRSLTTSPSSAQHRYLFPGKATPEATSAFSERVGRTEDFVQVHGLRLSNKMVCMNVTSDLDKALEAHANFVCYEHDKQSAAKSESTESSHCSLLQRFVNASNDGNVPGTEGSIVESPARSELVIGAKIKLPRENKMDLENAVDECRQALNVQTLDVVVLDMTDVDSSAKDQWVATLKSAQRLRAAGALQYVVVAADNVTVGHSERVDDATLSLKSILDAAEEITTESPSHLVAGVAFDNLALAGDSGLLDFADERGLLRMKLRGLEMLDEDGRPFFFSPRTVGTATRGPEQAELDPNAVVNNLKAAFDHCIHIENRFEEGKHNLHLPSEFDDVGMHWATILSQNLGQQPALQNIHEWEFIRDHQVAPSMTRALDVLRGIEDSRDVAYAYKLAMDSLFASISQSLLVNEQAYVSNCLFTFREDAGVVTSSMPFYAGMPRL